MVTCKKTSTKPEKHNLVFSDQVGSQEKLETVVLVEPGASSGDTYMPCVISKKQLEEMNAELASLKEKVHELAELPGNAALIDALRYILSDNSGKHSLIFFLIGALELKRVHRCWTCSK